MCSMYWNLIASVEAPCGHTSEVGLQTHFMGEAGSCMNYYRLDEPVPELEGYTGTLSAGGDAFVGECEQCNVFFECDAQIEAGRVVKVLNSIVAW